MDDSQTRPRYSRASAHLSHSAAAALGYSSEALTAGNVIFLFAWWGAILQGVLQILWCNVVVNRGEFVVGCVVKRGELTTTFPESKTRHFFEFIFCLFFFAYFFLVDSRSSRTIARYFRALSVTISGLPSAMAFAFTRSEPTPRAKAPASRNSFAVASETPPVGIRSIWGSGPVRAVRYFAPPIALAGNTFTTSAPASHAVTISVGVRAPGSTAAEYR